MNIAVDGFGGDLAPCEVIKGCRLAADEFDANIIITGDESKIRSTADKHKISLKNINICDAGSVIEMEDDPTSITTTHRDSSMAKGLDLLSSGEAAAFVSAGNTGALVVGSSLIAKRIKGITRAALAPLLPSDNGFFMLIDSGANVDCRPEMLRDFAIMGSLYIKKVKGVSSPKVGLVNVGVEPTKGRSLQKEAYALLEQAPINFCGNIEARDIPKGVCDVIVTDGFTGNIVLKLFEGVAMTMFSNIKDIFKQSALTKLSALMLKPYLMSFAKKLDYTEHGGAPLLGVNYPVIKAHGSSNALAIKNAIRQAKIFSEQNVIKHIKQNITVKNDI